MMRGGPMGRGYLTEEEKQNQQDYAVWMNHNTLERGNPVKKFKGDL